jgi:hypothetical protein
VTARSRSSPLLSRTRSNGDDLAPKIAQSVFCTSQGLFRERKIIRFAVSAFRKKKGSAATLAATAGGTVPPVGRRFATASHLVSYFGVFPAENSSGVNKLGQPLPTGHEAHAPEGK